jgi:hypothetical protein
MDRDGLIDLTHRSSDGTLMAEVLQPFFELEKDGSPFLISNPKHGALSLETSS